MLARVQAQTLARTSAQAQVPRLAQRLGRADLSKEALQLLLVQLQALLRYLVREEPADALEGPFLVDFGRCLTGRPSLGLLPAYPSAPSVELASCQHRIRKPKSYQLN